MQGKSCHRPGRVMPMRKNIPFYVMQRILSLYSVINRIPRLWFWQESGEKITYDIKDYLLYFIFITTINRERIKIAALVNITGSCFINIP